MLTKEYKLFIFLFYNEKTENPNKTFIIKNNAHKKK